MPGRTLTGLLLIAGALALASACGGDDGKPEVERVPIRHLDFEGMELTAADYFDPPFVDQYPDVVAEVNGEEITGAHLASQQVYMELDRRYYLTDVPDVFPDSYAASRLEELAATDPLEELIDRALQRQAVERLGLLPSYEEAVAYTREREADIAKLSPEDRAEADELNRLQGLPITDWASNEGIVEASRYAMGQAALRSRVCPTYPPPPVPGEPTATPIPEGPGTVVVSGLGCGGLIAHERERADVVYYVRWVD